MKITNVTSQLDVLRSPEDFVVVILEQGMCLLNFFTEFETTKNLDSPIIRKKVRHLEEEIRDALKFCIVRYKFQS